MKVLLVLALLLSLSAAWITGETHRYGLTISMTAGIPGMTTQVSKSVIEMDVDIKPKTGTEFLLQIHRVRVSKPKSSVDNVHSPMSMVRSPDLERDLNKPIKFTYENGEVTSYTLSKSDSLPSKGIKRGILRHLQMKTDYVYTRSQSGGDNLELHPIVHKTTESDELGSYDVYYGVIVGANPWFPNENNVFNISKTMDYEPYGYPSLREHHNFHLKGCRDVCRVGDNKYGAGCPGGYEPHQMPLKAGNVVHHNLRLLRGKMVIEGISARENHVASLYDQDMTVTINSSYVLKEVSHRKIDEPGEPQIEYTELSPLPTEEDIRKAHPSQPDDVSKQHRWIYGILDDVRSSEILQMATTIWQKVSSSIMAADIESTLGQEITQDVSQLQSILVLLKASHLSSLWTKVVDVNALRRAPEKEKIKRQIFLDILPLTGSDEALEFIKTLIHERKLSTWEASEVLEAIPENLVDPKEKNVRDLMTLLELPHVKRHHVLHSAAHMTVSSVVRDACIVSPTVDQKPSGHLEGVPKWLNQPKMSRIPDDDDEDGDDDSDFLINPMRFKKRPTKMRAEGPQCAESTVKKFLQDMHSKLKSAKRLEEKLIYMKALSNVGHKKCLKFLKPYIYGVAEDTEDMSPSDKDFLKKEALFSLFDIAKGYGYETLEVVAPVYFNRTESAAVRMAAFSVMMYCQPSLAVLQHIAHDSWDEPSTEVGNYIYSYFLTLGNTTTPCLKDLASKIKLVMSQMKTYDVGVQHSKFLIKTYFDELRNYGIDNRFALIQNNDSFVPTLLYGKTEYNVHSMKDFLMFGLHFHGLSIDDIFRAIDIEQLGIRLRRDIPTAVEREIFGSLHVLPSLPKEFRITMYKRMFYASSFHYTDAESLQKYLSPMIEHLRNHFSVQQGSLKGHFVKTFIPSSIHSVTYSSAGFPVHFQMKHPLVLSLKVESRRERTPSGLSPTYYIRPSVYYATYHKKSILNTANNHPHGVYHEEKHTFSLPIELSVSVDMDSNILEITSKLPEIPKSIYRRHSEAGTFVTELKLRKILWAEYSKEPIKTVPVLFQRELSFGGFGLPGLHIVYHTEDIEDDSNKLPRDSDEVYKQIFDTSFNAGWRKKDVNATIVTTSSTHINEVTFKISYNRSLDMPDRTQDSENDVTGNVEKHATEEMTPEYVDEIYRSFTEHLSKVAHEFSLHMETSPGKTFAGLRVEYNRTLDRMIHSVKAWGEAKLQERRNPYKICITNLMEFLNSPSELHYDISKYSRQIAAAFSALSFGDECKPLAQSDIFSTTVFTKDSPDELFSSDDFAEQPEPDAFAPETHEQCESDIGDGNSHSAACLASIIEESHFNKMTLKIFSEKELPPELKNITHKLEDLMKYYYFANVDVNSLNVNNPPKTFEMTMKYFEKLTDTPVLDIFMKKPKENVTYKKIDPGYYFQPLSSVYSILDSHLLHASNNTYLPSCALTGKYLRTFNMEEYPLPQDKCTYVLSTHCTERKKFAVVVKSFDTSGYNKELTVYIANQKVLLRPSGTNGRYTVISNENFIDVTPDKPKLLDPESQLYVFLESVYGHDVSHVLHLNAEKAGISIHYDGKNILLKVNPLYKGELCGLCGKYDGETVHEFRGSSQCLHMDSEDFAHSFITDSDSCGVRSEPKGPVICPSGEHSIPGVSLWSSSPNHPSQGQYIPIRPFPYIPPLHKEDNEDENGADATEVVTEDVIEENGKNEPLLRNIKIRRKDELCFSIHPVPVCPEGSDPVQVYTQAVGFHCFPKNDAHSHRLETESRTKVLNELLSERVDFDEAIFGALSCSPY